MKARKHKVKTTHPSPPPRSNERPPTPSPDAEMRKKLVLLYDDESIFNSYEGQIWMWAAQGTPAIQPKTKGAGVIVSDFVDLHRGYLQLTDTEHAVTQPVFQIF